MIFQIRLKYILVDVTHINCTQTTIYGTWYSNPSQIMLPPYNFVFYSDLIKLQEYHLFCSTSTTFFIFRYFKVSYLMLAQFINLTERKGNK